MAMMTGRECIESLRPLRKAGKVCREEDTTKILYLKPGWYRTHRELQEKIVAFKC